MSFGRQLRALITKNFIIKKRLWKQTIWEFIIPLAYCFILSLFSNASGIGYFLIYFIAVFIPASFQITSRFILMQMVVDKETKMKETLRIMSMKSAAYGLSYFITQFIVIFVISTMMMILFVYLDVI